MVLPICEARIPLPGLWISCGMSICYTKRGKSILLGLVNNKRDNPSLSLAAVAGR